MESESTQRQTEAAAPRHVDGPVARSVLSGAIFCFDYLSIVNIITEFETKKYVKSSITYIFFDPWKKLSRRATKRSRLSFPERDKFSF